MSRRRPGKGRPPVRPGRPKLPEVAKIRLPPSPPGSKRRVGKGKQRMIFGNRIIQVEGISLIKFNIEEKKVIK